jgi:hypothetical protein
MGPKVALRLEEGKSRGAHADFRFAFPGSPDARSIELKAVGLSDAEIGFCERMAPLLESLLPLDGIVHLHAGIDQDLADISPEAQRSMKQAAVLSARVIQHHPAGLRGTTIVGHGAEANYARRVSLRVIQEAVEQLPVADECWVAVYWSNGAPMDDVRAVIPWEEIPSHIHGLVLLGCGVILGDPQFHCFSSRISRRARKADKTTVRSSHPREHEAAALALEAFERSSGVRPTLLKVGKRTLLRRDGNERIMPFNLLAAWDPPGVGRSDDMPSWMS